MLKNVGVIMISVVMLGAHPVRADLQLPFKVGEVLHYDVSWSGYVTAGTATLTLRERLNGPGRAGYDAIAEAKPTSVIERLYHLYYKAESFLDTKTLRPFAATVYSDERGRTRLRTTKFLPGDVVELEVKTTTVVRSTATVQPGTYDALSAMYALRAMVSRPGQTVAMPIVNNGRMYRLNALVRGREQLDTALGRLPAFRVMLSLADGQGHPATTRNMTLWFSEDARRVPLRMEVGLPVGNFVLSLTRISG
jgi:hypothetical protein